MRTNIIEKFTYLSTIVIFGSFIVFVNCIFEFFDCRRGICFMALVQLLLDGPVFRQGVYDCFQLIEVGCIYRWAAKTNRKVI